VPNFESPAESLPGPRIQKSKSIFETVESGHTAPATREGLPPSYRMRADPHYVDLLASRTSTGRERILAVQAIDAASPSDPAAIAQLTDSIKRDGVLQPLLIQHREGTYRLISGAKRLSAAAAAGLREVPCVVFDVDDDEAARLAEAANIGAKSAAGASKGEHGDLSLHGGADLAQSLAMLGACADLVSGPHADWSRAVAGNLIRAEVWRASSLLHATRIIRREIAISRTAASVLAVLDRVEQGFRAERQVRAISLDTRSSVPHGSFIAADEQMLTAAISCAVLTTLSLVDGAKDVRMTIAAALEPAGHVTFSVSQESVVLPEVWQRRAFDDQWAERPGGVPATIWMLAIRATAEAHGGTATMGPATRGTRITLAVPTGI
jgi:ParB-like nuclease family protein